MKTARYGIDDRPIFVIDQSRCIGCEACVQACSECGTHRGQSLIHLERIDRAAVYKHWARKSPATLGPERTSALARMNRLRPLWVLRGYIGARRDDRRRG